MILPYRANLAILIWNEYSAVITIREQSYFALAALMDGPLHGYAIIKRAEELSGGRVRMAAGTLYAALDRLSAEGLLRVVDEEVVNGRARRYYNLTDEGVATLRAEADRMIQAARVVTDRPALRIRAVRPA